MHDKKIAIITGGSSGIGRATVLELAKDGFTVVFTYVTEHHAQELGNILKQQGLHADAIKCDIAKPDNISAMIEEVMHKYGHIDVLVNSAGISNTKPVEEIDVSEWDRMIDVNLKGAFFCAKHAYMKMKSTGGGVIVCITSIAGERGGHYSGVHYSASKGGVAAMVKSLALSGAEFGIRVNAVAPGVVETEMSKSEGIPITGIPMGRAATPEEIAAAVSFLVSEKASYITGTTLNVTGGMLMH